MWGKFSFLSINELFLRSWLIVKNGRDIGDTTGESEKGAGDCFGVRPRCRNDTPLCMVLYTTMVEIGFPLRYCIEGEGWSGWVVGREVLLI